MSAAPKQEAVAAFVPDADDNSVDSSWIGKRRGKDALEPVVALPLRWPATPKERYDIFDGWHDVSMQILRNAKAGLHIAAAAKKVVRWSDGTIIDSNAELASRAGYPSEKTISREVQAYIALGLFIPTFEWKRPDGRKFITVRTLRLSLPEKLPEWVKLPDGKPVSLDTRGPDLAAPSLDTRGPDPLDTRGPATIDHKKGAGDESA